MLLLRVVASVLLKQCKYVCAPADAYNMSRVWHTKSIPSLWQMYERALLTGSRNSRLYIFISTRMMVGWLKKLDLPAIGCKSVLWGRIRSGWKGCWWSSIYTEDGQIWLHILWTCFDKYWWPNTGVGKIKEWCPYATCLITLSPEDTCRLVLGDAPLTFCMATNSPYWHHKATLPLKLFFFLKC